MIIEKKYLDLLQEFGTHDNPHSNRTLMDHLVGTCNLLAAWGCDEELCLAGLFHSIYGTEIYKVQSAALAYRPRLSRLLGQRVEEIVYLFCVCERKAFFAQADAAAPVLFDNLLRRNVSCSAAILRDLIELSVANEFEQLPNDYVFSAGQRAAFIRLFESGFKSLSAGARQACMERLDIVIA